MNGGDGAVALPQACEGAAGARALAVHRRAGPGRGVGVGAGAGVAAVGVVRAACVVRAADVERPVHVGPLLVVRVLGRQVVAVLLLRHRRLQRWQRHRLLCVASQATAARPCAGPCTSACARGPTRTAVAVGQGGHMRTVITAHPRGGGREDGG